MRKSLSSEERSVERSRETSSVAIVSYVMNYSKG